MCQTNQIREDDCEKGPKTNDESPKSGGITIDEALTKTKFGFFNYSLILLSGICLGATYLETCGVSFIMPVSQRDLKLTSEEKGILGGACFIGIIISSHLWGFLADTTGRKIVIQPTLVVAFVLSVLSSFTDDFRVLAVLRFLNGFFASGSSAIIYAYLGEFHSNAFLLTICSSISGNFYFLFTFRCLNGFFISSGAVTILAYLGEFHSDNHRTRALTASHFVSAIVGMMLPSVAFSIINQEWQTNQIREDDCEKGPKTNDESPKSGGITIDEALTKTKFGFFNYSLILLSGICLGATYLETCGVSFIMPVSQRDLKLTSEEKGILGGACFIGIIISSHLWGFLADTTGRKIVIQPTLVVAFVLSVLSSFTDDFRVLAVLRFLNGFFASGSSAIIYAYLGEFHSNAFLLTICSSISGNFYFLFTFRCLNGFFISSGAVTILAYLEEFHSDNHRTRALTASHFVSAIVGMMLPSVAFSIINQEWQFEVPLLDLTYKPWRLFLFVCGIPLFLVSIALFFLPESPKFMLDQGKQEETIEILERINGWNNSKGAELGYTEIYEEAESIENRRKAMEEKNGRFAFFKSIYNQTVPVFKPPYLKPTLLLCAIIFINFSMANGFYLFFITIVNQYNSNLDQFNNQKVEMCHIISMNGTSSAEMIDESISCVPAKIEVATLIQSTILESSYVVGLGLNSLLIERVGKFAVMTFSFGISALGAFICMLSHNAIIQICALIVFMACGVGASVLNVSVVEIYPTSTRAMAFSLTILFSRFGSMVGSNVFAYLLSNECEVSFFLSGILLLGCIALGYFVPNIHQKRLRAVS